MYHEVKGKNASIGNKIIGIVQAEYKKDVVSRYHSRNVVLSLCR